MVAGPGAAYICDECLQLCNDILQDPTPFSTRALELASRPPIVIAAPLPLTQHQQEKPDASEPAKIITLEVEQKQNGMILILHQLQYYQSFFDLIYMWIRPPLQPGFSFVPRIIFFLKDTTGKQWTGDQGGVMLARPDLTNGPNQAVYQGSARFRPLPSTQARILTIRAVDPLGQFDAYPSQPWHFEVTL
jgi:hypothetical protein